MCFTVKIKLYPFLDSWDYTETNNGLIMFNLVNNNNTSHLTYTFYNVFIQYYKLLTGLLRIVIFINVGSTSKIRHWLIDCRTSWNAITRITVHFCVEIWLASIKRCRHRYFKLWSIASKYCFSSPISFVNRVPPTWNLCLFIRLYTGCAIFGYTAIIWLF